MELSNGISEHVIIASIVVFEYATCRLRTRTYVRACCTWVGARRDLFNRTHVGYMKPRNHVSIRDIREHTLFLFSRNAKYTRCEIRGACEQTGFALSLDYNSLIERTNVCKTNETCTFLRTRDCEQPYDATIAIVRCTTSIISLKNKNCGSFFFFLSTITSLYALMRFSLRGFSRTNEGESETGYVKR